MTPLESDLGWAAGLIDGEGHICLEKKRAWAPGPSFAPRVAVYNCNEAIVTRFARIVGCGTIRLGKRKDPTKHRQAFQWRVGGQDAIAVCRLLLPYLSKRDQAGLLIQAGPLILSAGRPRGRQNPNIAKLERLHRELRKLTKRGPRNEESITLPMISEDRQL